MGPVCSRNQSLGSIVSSYALSRPPKGCSFGGLTVCTRRPRIANFVVGFNFGCSAAMRRPLSATHQLLFVRKPQVDSHVPKTKNDGVSLMPESQ